MGPGQIDKWAGIAGTAVCVGVAAPVAIEQLRGDVVTAGPWWLWWIPYVTYLGVLLAGDRALRVHRSRQTPTGLLLVTGCLVVGLMTSPLFAFAAVLLVFTAAAAAYSASPNISIGIIIIQTAVVALTGFRTGEPAVFVVGVVVTYAFLQVFVALASRGELFAARTRQELARVNVELQAAHALLEGSARTKERLRIARELHDAVGHHLTVLTLQLEVASHRATPPVTEHVQQALNVARQLLGEVRASVTELREQPADLSGALHRLTRDLPHLRVHLAVDPALRLDEDQAAELVRCVQEVLTNCLRHADADNLWVSVDQVNNQLLLDARDDGRGAASLQLGNGLAGLRERIEGLGGVVSFDGGDGFRVTARLPT